MFGLNRGNGYWCSRTVNMTALVLFCK